MAVVARAANEPVSSSLSGYGNIASLSNGLAILDIQRPATEVAHAFV